MQFLKRCFDRFNDAEVTQVSAQLAYFLLLSLFPFLIFLLNVLSFTPLATQGILEPLFNLMPQEVAKLVSGIVQETVASKNTTILSISLILTIWSGSQGIDNVMIGIRKVFKVEEKRNPITQRLLAIVFMFLLVGLIILVLVSQVFGEVILKFISSLIAQPELVNSSFHIINRMVVFIAMVVVFMMIYLMSPNFKTSRPSLFSVFVGGCFAALGWLVVSYLFAYYVNHFSHFAVTYGSLGAIISLMLWLYFSSMIIMMGAIVSAMINEKQ